MPPEPRRLLIDVDAASSVRKAVGPTAWFVLEALAVRAPAGLSMVEIECSSRAVAESLDLSKDTVARSLRLLATVGIIDRIDHRNSRSGRFESSVYRVDLAAAGLRIDGVPRQLERAPEDTSHRPPSRVEHDPSGDQLSLLG
jgi:hypothetical protein